MEDTQEQGPSPQVEANLSGRSALKAEILNEILFKAWAGSTGGAAGPETNAENEPGTSESGGINSIGNSLGVIKLAPRDDQANPHGVGHYYYIYISLGLLGWVE